MSIWDYFKEIVTYESTVEFYQSSKKNWVPNLKHKTCDYNGRKRNEETKEKHVLENEKYYQKFAFTRLWGLVPVSGSLLGGGGVQFHKVNWERS